MNDNVVSLCLGILLAASASALDLPKDPDVGLYLSDGADWIESPAEVVNWKTGSAAKSVLTLGIVKEDTNGRVSGGASGAVFSGTARMEALIHTVEGTSGGEYQLIRLRRRPEAREFRSVERDSMSFQAIEVAPRLWRVNLGSLPPGEYGFVPPGDSKSLAGPGKIYTFTIGECLECKAAAPGWQAAKHRLFGSKNPALDF